MPLPTIKVQTWQDYLGKKKFLLWNFSTIFSKLDQHQVQFAYFDAL